MSFSPTRSDLRSPHMYVAIIYNEKVNSEDLQQQHYEVGLFRKRYDWLARYENNCRVKLIFNKH